MTDRTAQCFAIALAAALFGLGCAEGSVEPGTDDDGGSTGGNVDADVTVDDDTGPDAGPDAGPTDDTGPDDDADAGPSVPPTQFKYSNSGGGTTSSSNYKLEISVGAPGTGASESDDHRLRVAPVSP